MGNTELSDLLKIVSGSVVKNVSEKANLSCYVRSLIIY